MFRHPKYYKELRKRNRAGSIDGAMLPDSQSDQAISQANSTRGLSGVRSGPGLQVTSHKLPGPRPISNANKGLIHKQQASSAKLLKLQAASVKPRG